MRYHFAVSDHEPAAAARLLETTACIARLAQGELNERAAALGLQRVHLQALAYLARANRYSNTAAALAEYLASSKGTVSQSLQLLERKGLIRREADGVDRRVVRLALTARAARALRAFDFARDWGEALGSLAPGRAAAADATLQAALGALQRGREYLSFGVCRTCRHFGVEGEAAFRCGLTGEPLSVADASQICREHRMAEPMPTPARRSRPQPSQPSRA
jgi:DNA-binding MarR family transcriptional regulator